MVDDDKVQKKFQLLSFHVNTKVVQSVNRMSERQTDRKTERLFSLVIKTKVVQSVNRMSKSR